MTGSVTGTLPAFGMPCKEPLMQARGLFSPLQAALELAVARGAQVFCTPAQNLTELLLQVTLLLAKAAIGAEDWSAATALTLPLADESYAPAWKLAATIVRAPGASGEDSTSMDQLLAFAVAHCDLEEVSDSSEINPFLDAAAKSDSHACHLL